MTALANLKILDFSTLLPGPFATMMLADLGAEVLRIESPTRPDLCREMAPFADGVSTKHAALNRNKRSITLDLKVPAAVALVKQLLADYDIVIEQFRPGVMRRLGLDYDSLRSINPRLIYCSVTGYGQTGPYRDRAGHDNNYLSISGLNGQSGRPGENTAIMGTQIADIAGGSLHAVIGILAAVNQRQQTGVGQLIDISMTDAAFSLNMMFGSDYLAAGQNPEPCSTVLNGGSFYDYYRTADQRSLSIGSLEPQFFTRMCLIIGGQALLALGQDHSPRGQQIFKQALGAAVAQKTLAQWQALFADEDACVEPVLSFAEACEHPQILAREMIVEVPVDAKRRQAQIASPLKLSASPVQYRHIGAPSGQDNRALLQQLGLSASEIEQLLATGAMG